MFNVFFGLGRPKDLWQGLRREIGWHFRYKDVINAFQMLTTGVRGSLFLHM